MFSDRLEPSENQSGICCALAGQLCEISANYEHPGFHLVTVGGPILIMTKNLRNTNVF